MFSRRSRSFRMTPPPPPPPSPRPSAGFRGRLRAASRFASTPDVETTTPMDVPTPMGVPTPTFEQEVVPGRIKDKELAPQTSMFDDGSVLNTTVQPPEIEPPRPPIEVPATVNLKAGGKVKSASKQKTTIKQNSASKRGDGIAQRGKTKGRFV